MAQRGKVKWFDRKKGYGFITYKDESTGALKDVFVHHNGIDGTGFKSLEDGQAVEFDVKQGAKGPEAVGVRSA